MTISRDSLSGQNSPGRRSGARSSRALSTIFKKLRSLDRRIEALDAFIRRVQPGSHWAIKEGKKRAALDEQRKAVRNQRKGYLANKDYPANFPHNP